MNWSTSNSNRRWWWWWWLSISVKCMRIWYINWKEKLYPFFLVSFFFTVIK